MNKKPHIIKNSSKKHHASKIKLVSIVVFLALSLGLLLGIMQTPQDIRQRAQNTPGREPAPPPICAATGGQPNTGVCIPTTEGCLPGEEQDEGQLDCAVGQTCCSLAEVPTECAAQSNGQTFCSTAANCTGTATNINLGQLDCADGIICCKNPLFPTQTPTPTEKPEPTTPEDPTPTFGSISVPTEEPTEEPQDQPTAPPANPENPQNPNPQPQPAPPPANQGLLQLIILFIIKLFLVLLGR